MRSLSADWEALVERWSEIAKSMDDEVGIDWSKDRSAPRTYELMKSVMAHLWIDGRRNKAADEAHAARYRK